MSRGQTNLATLAVALLLVSTAVTVGLALADGAVAGALRDPNEERVAVALSERLVSAEGPLTVRANVLDRDRVDRLDAASFREDFPVSADKNIRVALDDRTVVTTGTPTDGTTFSRIVLVARRRNVTVQPRFTADEPAVTLPRRSDAATLIIDPPGRRTVWTVWANDRVVLHDPDGLTGRYEIRLSRFETTRLAFNASDPLPPGSVTVRYAPETTTKRLLTVTVDA